MTWQSFRNTVIALAATGALVGPVLLPDRAAATLPGRDGLIAWAFDSASFTLTNPNNQLSNLNLQGILTVTGAGRSAHMIVSCKYTTEHDQTSQCPEWADVSYAPGGKRLAWDIARHPIGTDDQIVIGDAAGRPAYRVGRDDIEPSFSSDGRRIVFVRLRAHRDQIVVSDLHGADARVIATSDASAPVPSFSPDGRWILFDDNEAAWVVSAAGGRPRLLIRGALTPDWSPSGKEIAYVGARLGRLFIAHADGTHPRELPTGGLCYAPRCQVNGGGTTFVVFSPDGRRLAFDGESQSGGIGNSDDNLYTIPVSGGRAKEVAVGPPIEGNESFVQATLGISWQSLP
jgi:dipeptidyl aminopeptidase/acylaminoacyl peptidase